MCGARASGCALAALLRACHLVRQLPGAASCSHWRNGGAIAGTGATALHPCETHHAHLARPREVSEAALARVSSLVQRGAARAQDRLLEVRYRATRRRTPRQQLRSGAQLAIV
jgi:hypothetical protein